MKKIVLLITFGCFAFCSASYAQSASTVLSPAPSAAKTNMTDSQTPATDAPATDKKSDTKASCTKSGCTGSKDVKKDCCKKPADKGDNKPTFMQDNSTAPAAPKKD